MSEKLIDLEMPLPAIIGRYPSCRKIFDRYGLEGCGGRLGPQESLAFFARAHRVDEAKLLAELEEAARAGQIRPAQLEYKPGVADVIYRRFFRAGIVSMFTFGCVLGGINLAIMAARHELASLDLRAVTWAHAHAQVAGWVTFFIMGFAYQAVPRFKFTTLWRPRLAAATLPVMAVALTFRTLADLWQTHPFWNLAGRIGGLTELAVVTAFAWILARTILGSRQSIEPYEKFLFAALSWMVAAFGFDVWIFAASARVEGYKAWVNFISLYDAPWRDAQLLGFAGGMILGVSQRFLPFMCGFREVTARRSRVVFYLWNAGVAVNVVAYSLLIRTRRPLWGILLEASILALFTAVLLLVRAFGLFSVGVEPDRSVPFLRAAYFWALTALALFALLPVYTAWKRMPFSHAYFGGYRHAFTVGFISMMIVGVSSKVAPVLGGLRLDRLPRLRPTFWLINAGSAMRVVFQILTDSFAWAYPLMAVSAWVEVTGLGIWAVDLWRTMRQRPDADGATGDVAILPGTRVFDVIESHPETLPVFLAFGFSMINNLAARKVFARSVSLEQACRLKHVPYDEFSAALQRAIGGSGAEAPSVPLLTIRPAGQ